MWGDLNSSSGSGQDVRVQFALADGQNIESQPFNCVTDHWTNVDFWISSSVLDLTILIILCRYCWVAFEELMFAFLIVLEMIEFCGVTTNHN